MKNKFTPTIKLALAVFLALIWLFLVQGEYEMITKSSLQNDFPIIKGIYAVLFLGFILLVIGAIIVYLLFSIKKNKTDYATKFIGKTVHIIIDRPLGSKHPKYNMVYPINYGYVPNTKAPDKNEIDAYILGISEPLKEYMGQCMAVIHRKNDNDDKLIIVPNNKTFTDKEIKAMIEFQEKYFQSEIIRQP